MRKIIYSIMLILMTAISLIVCSPRSSGREKTSHDPEAAKLITSDLDNFWRAYADAANTTNAEENEKIFQREYLDKGSAGLKDFLQLRIKSAHELVGVIARNAEVLCVDERNNFARCRNGAGHSSQLRKTERAISERGFPGRVFSDWCYEFRRHHRQ